MKAARLSPFRTAASILKLKPEQISMLSRFGVALVSGLSMGVGTVAAEELKPFRVLLDHGVRLAIVSKLLPSSYKELVEKIALDDGGQVFDNTQIGVDLENADMAVFILTKWSDADLLPARQYLEPYYNDVATAKVHEIKKTYAVETTSGRPFLLVFYNLNATPTVDIDCLARDIAREASSADVSYKIANYPCK